MKKELGIQKAELKERVNQEIDKYYEQIEEGLKRKSLKIDKIEQLMKEKKAKLNEMLVEATGEAVEEAETEDKKNALNAGGECGGKTAGRK